MSFDPEALRQLSGGRERPRRPVTLAYLLKVGAGAGVAAALCDLAVLVIARAADWSTTVDGVAVQPLAIVGVCLVVGLLAALGAYAAARVTRKPSLWVLLAGLVLWVASLPGLPPAVVALHSVTALWVVGWLVAATRSGSHMGD